MRGASRTLLAGLGIVIAAWAQQDEEAGPVAEGKGYRIDQPGTITFTTGVKIKGKVEKPQVMILLPKEKSTYRDMTLSHSFKDDVAKPLPFTPLRK
jgi:hypothetical protein